MNWIMIQAAATVALVAVVAADSIVYYLWHAKHERVRNPYSPTAIKALQEYKEITLDESGK